MGIAPTYFASYPLTTQPTPKLTVQSLTTLRDRLAKIGAKIVRHVRSIAFQMAEVMVTRALFRQILAAIASLRSEAPIRR